VISGEIVHLLRHRRIGGSTEWLRELTEAEEAEVELPYP